MKQPYPRIPIDGMPSTLDLLGIIKTAEWHRYTGHMPTYATAGTTGIGAIDVRCALPMWTDGPQPIEYRHVGSDDDWSPTGFTAVMRYDQSREQESDGDGYDFIPYHVTELSATFL